jgi:hypothetical protein
MNVGQNITSWTVPYIYYMGTSHKNISWNVPYIFYIGTFNKKHFIDRSIYILYWNVPGKCGMKCSRYNGLSVSLPLAAANNKSWSVFGVCHLKTLLEHDHFFVFNGEFVRNIFISTLNGNRVMVGYDREPDVATLNSESNEANYVRRSSLKVVTMPPLMLTWGNLRLFCQKDCEPSYCR